MEVRRQTLLYFFICCCAKTIYTDELVTGNKASTTLPNEDSNKEIELQTGQLSGTMTAHKNGVKLKFKINSTVIWDKDKWTQKCIAEADEHKGEKGNKGIVGVAATVGEKGQKGDRGSDGLPGIKGEKGVKGEKGNKGENGVAGTKGEKGEKGDQGPEGYIGFPGVKGEKGEKGDKGIDGIAGRNGEKGEKGDKGADGLKGEKGETGDRGNNGLTGVKGEKGEKGEKGDKGIDGIAGTKGDKGEKGDKGDEGVKGEKGDAGTCDASYGERLADNIGLENYPAHSCRDIADNGQYYVNQAKQFEVSCQSYKTCIHNLPESSISLNVIKNEKVWLSSLKLNLNKFYHSKMSQLSYLMSTNEAFSLILKYNNEVKLLKILSWNGITMDIGTLWNGCKSEIKKEESYTILKLECKPPNFLPMDFYMEATTENISVQITNLCFI